LHDPGHRGCEIPDHPSIQIRVQPLVVGSQIRCELLGPKLAFFFCRLFLVYLCAILKEHEDDLLFH
jgi:hypothetical protein